MAGLKVVYSRPHVSICNEQHDFEGLFPDLHVFLLHDHFDTLGHVLLLEFVEPERHASTLNRLYDALGVVAAQ